MTIVSHNGESSTKSGTPNVDNSLIKYSSSLVHYDAATAMLAAAIGGGSEECQCLLYNSNAHPSAHVKSGEIIELDDSDYDPGDDKDNLPSRHKVIKLCETLERVCLMYSSEKFFLGLPRQLCKFRAELLHKEFQNHTQMLLVDYFAVETCR